MDMKKIRWEQPVAAFVGLLAAAAWTYQGSQAALGSQPEAMHSDQVLSLSQSHDVDHFAVPALKPGESASRCASVVYRRHDAARLRLYANGLATTRGLGQLLEVRVETGRAAPHGGDACASFTPTRTLFDGPLGTFPTTWASSGSQISLPGSGADKVAIRVSYTFSAAATNAAQGGTAQLGLVYGVEAA
jgi:hypothetical protein